jgi:hypothetical protein
VGLESLVKIVCADFTRRVFEPEEFDVLWLQGSWNHVSEKKKALIRWAPALKPGGRVAIEDVFLRARPLRAGEQQIVRRLVRQWHSDLRLIGDWISALWEGQFDIISVKDLTAEFWNYYTSLWSRAAADSLERRSWRDALHLTRKHYIGYVRMIGEKSVSA